MKGEKGDKGDTGATGPQGDKGDTGATGATGQQGIQGEKGDKGDKGDAGTNATTTEVATTTANGLMSSADKTELDTINSKFNSDGLIENSDKVDGYHILQVSALPTTPDANTLYIVT